MLRTTFNDCKWLRDDSSLDIPRMFRSKAFDSLCKKRGVGIQKSVCRFCHDYEPIKNEIESHDQIIERLLKENEDLRDD